MRVAELSRRPRLLSQDDSDRQRGVAMSITVSISAIQFHTPDVDTDEKSNSRRSLSLILISVGADHPCWRKPHVVASHWLERSSCRFPVTLLVFSRADHSTSQVLTISHVVFISTFTEGLLQKASMLIWPPLIGSTAVTSHAAVTSDAHSIQISSQKIRILC